jgi:hypothetical protein
MRAALIVLLSLTAIACSKESASDAHLKQAGAEAKAAVADVGKAVDATAPAIKQAGAQMGRGLKAADADLKASAKRAKDKVEDAD